MKTIAELTEAAASASGQCMGADFERALILLTIAVCADIADAESSCEGIAQRIRDNIMAAAKDLK